MCKLQSLTIPLKIKKTLISNIFFKSTNFIKNILKFHAMYKIINSWKFEFS